MSFLKAVEQAKEFLERNGRVSLRSLKREFALDDDALEDLVEELVAVHSIALRVDDTLTWRDSEFSAGSAARSDSIRETDGDRRQLTVMFCDIVGSTALSGRLDPEDMREYLRSYQHDVAAVVERFNGYIAQYLGDGILAYFGYPKAHDNDAESAMRSALGILQALRSADNSPHKPTEVRIGIHTGQVVVGDVGHAGHRELLALGEAPNIAARLESLAEPNSILVSAATHQLVRGLFKFSHLGSRDLIGVERAIEVFELTGENHERSRFDVALKSGLGEMVGREPELNLLRERWALAQAGSGQIVLLSGEPGIGKSRLVQELKNQIQSENAEQIEFRCSPYHQNSSLRPIIEHLQRYLSFDSTSTAESKFEKLETMLSGYRFAGSETAALLGALLSVAPESSNKLLSENPQKRKQALLSSLLSWVLEETEHKPVCTFWEDLHWADPSTLELLENLLLQVPSSRLLAVLSFRPEFSPPWGTLANQTHLTLNRLDLVQVQELINRVTHGKSLPEEVTRQIVTKTDCVPLFVEELTKMVVESGLVIAKPDRYEMAGPLPPLAIPSTLHDSLMARLDRMAAVREIAQLGATIGRQFDYELLRYVSPLPEQELQNGLAELVESGLIYQRGLPPQASYTFKHALVQDTAYQSLLKGSRARLHARIAQALENKFPSTVEHQPELLALHYSGAGLAEAAIDYWQKAGSRAVQSSANLEAVEHLNNGLQLLNELPYSDTRELALLTQLGPALIATKGYGAAETAACFDKAHDLTQKIPDSPHLFPVLYGCWVYKMTWAEFSVSETMAEDFLALAIERNETSAILTGHRILGFSQSCIGDFEPAKKNFESVIALYDPLQHAPLAYRYGQDPCAAAGSMLAWNLWHLGYPDRAVALCDEMLELARRLDHTNTRGYVETFGAARIHLFRRDTDALSAILESMTRLCDDHKLVFWLGFVRAFEGWLLAERGHSQQGVRAIESAIRELDTIGTAMLRPHVLGLFAEALYADGDFNRALETIDDALEIAIQSNERWSVPELHRLRGEIILAKSESNSQVFEAQQCFQESVSIANRAGARGWELRGATSLARSIHQQGDHRGAAAVLTPVFDNFSEGFDTPDLVDAGLLLQEISEAQR